MQKAKKPARSARTTFSWRATSARLAAFASARRMLIVTAGCVTAVVAIVAAGIASRSADPAVAATQPDAHAASRPAAAATRQAATTRRSDARKPVVQASADSDTTADSDAAPVTLTGCLQSDDETFWLKDASGDGAPTARSWKSGFLKKRPARVALVDSPKALQLTSYVGQRVAATGTLVNREMHARSLRRVAGTCG